MKNRVNDLFIKVKGYTGKIPYFYWTKNEIQKDSDNSSKYCIYLMNRSRIKQSDYQPP